MNNITIENVLLSFYAKENLRWLLCDWLWDILYVQLCDIHVCTIYKLSVVGIKVSLLIEKCLWLILGSNITYCLERD